MQVFLCWSGERSRAMAETLNEWLPQVIQAVKPWISIDTKKGQRWSPEIARKLEESKFGIICLTRENIHEDWILFESGALSKTKDSYPCTFLLDLKPSDLEEPLSQFQHTQFDKEDIKKLVETINESVEPPLLDNKILDKSFDTFWLKLEEALNQIQAKEPETEKPMRKDSDLLEEILTTVRRLEQKQTTSREPGPYERALADYPLQQIDQIADMLLFSLANKSDEELKKLFKASREQRYPSYQSILADALGRYGESSSSSASSSSPSSKTSSSSSSISSSSKSRADEES